MADATCLSCFKSHVKCERSIPCKRCLRLGLKCVPNPRPRGRPKKGAAGGSDHSVGSQDRGSARPPAPSAWAGGGGGHLFQPLGGLGGVLPHDPFRPAGGGGGGGGGIGAFLEGGGALGHAAAARSLGPPSMQGYDDDDRSLSSYQSSTAGGYEGPPAPAPHALPPHGANPMGLPQPPHGPPHGVFPPSYPDIGGGPPPYPLEGIAYPSSGSAMAAGGGGGSTSNGGPGAVPHPAGPTSPLQQGGMVPQEQQIGASAAGGADSLALKMMGPFVAMLSAGEVAVERTRHLLTSWHLWSLEHGQGREKDRPAPEDVMEVAALIGLNLPSSYASWLELRGGAASSPEEDEQVQSFLDMCVDDDGSAICSAVYSGGGVQLNLNSRFAAMYLTLEELEATVARDRLRPELVWRRLLSPECSGAYDEALCQAYFKGQNLGGEACEIVKCVDRFGLEMPCFMRLRVFASSKGAITASVIFLLPLQLSRLVENT